MQANIEIDYNQDRKKIAVECPIPQVGKQPVLQSLNFWVLQDANDLSKYQTNVASTVL